MDSGCGPPVASSSNPVVSPGSRGNPAYPVFWRLETNGGSITVPKAASGWPRWGATASTDWRWEAGRESGEMTSLPLRPPGRTWRRHRLTVNVSGLSGGASLEAELLDGVRQSPLEGFSLARSVAIERDGYEVPLRWEPGGGQLPEMPKPLRVRLRMTRGKGNPQLHGLYVRPADGR